MAIKNESFTNPLASESSFGRTMAMGYVKAAIGATIATKALKTPSNPKASAP